MAKKNSYAPDLIGAAYMDSIAYRYPYPFPPRLKKGPHPVVDGLPTPGGKAYTGRKTRAASDNRAAKL